MWDILTKKSTAKSCPAYTVSLSIVSHICIQNAASLLHSLIYYSLILTQASNSQFGKYVYFALLSVTCVYLTLNIRRKIDPSPIFVKNLFTLFHFLILYFGDARWRSISHSLAIHGLSRVCVCALIIFDFLHFDYIYETFGAPFTYRDL